MALPVQVPTFLMLMPLFRLAEMYLIYAEAVVRGGTGGDAATALQYINALGTEPMEMLRAVLPLAIDSRFYSR